MARFILLVALGWFSLMALAAEPPELTPPRHPYLLFTPEKTSLLKERITTEPTFAKAWSELQKNAESLLGKKDSKTEALQTLGLVYCVTGDKRYAAKCREILLDACAKQSWVEAQFPQRIPPWNSALDTARTNFDTAVGFDCIHDFLPQEDRESIAAGMVRLGILPTLSDWVLGEKRIHSLDTMGHNWWSVCVSMAGFAALAVLEEEPRAREWLKRIDEAFPEWFNYSGSNLETKPATFDRAGGIYESVGYNSYAMAQYLLFRLAWTNTFPLHPPVPIPQLQKAGDYFINVCYPNSAVPMSLTFGDSSLHSTGSLPVLLLWALGDHRADYLWYLKETKTEAFRGDAKRSSPVGLLYYPDDRELSAAPASPSLPPSTLFGNMGWAILRSSWQDNATMLAVKSGFTWNHAHADAGSFLLFYKGKYLLIDSGTCDYSRPEYTSYYRQSRAHNVMLFNSKAENPEDIVSGSQTSGSVSHLIDAGDLKYVLADATGPTGRYFIRNFRNFLWIGNVILVMDDVKSFDPGVFSWLLHYGGLAESKGSDLAIRQGDASVLVRALLPASLPDGSATEHKMKLLSQGGLVDHNPGASTNYFCFQAPEPTRQTSFITAIVLENGEMPQLEKLEGKNFCGVRIHQAGKTTDVYFNLLAQGRAHHSNACINANGWETDAYLSAVTYADGGNVSRYFIADGSYLRRDGALIFDSLSKVYISASMTGEKLDLILQGQPVLNARFKPGNTPAEVTLNGVRISHERQEGMIRLCLPDH